MFDLPPEAREEWTRADAAISTKALTLAARFHTTADFVRYITNNRGFAKYIYPLAGWVEDPNLRLTMGVAFALHCFGIKLLDDIIDHDKPFAPADLMVGSQLCDQALVELFSIRALDSFFETYPRYWPAIWTHLKQEPTAVIHSVAEWEASARVKCGSILSFYGETACVYAKKQSYLDNVRNGLVAMGVVYTLMDDIRDAHLPTEQHANLKALVRRGIVPLSAVIQMLERAAAQVETALRLAPPHFPLAMRCFQDVTKVRKAIQNPEMVLV